MNARGVVLGLCLLVVSNGCAPLPENETPGLAGENVLGRELVRAGVSLDAIGVGNDGTRVDPGDPQRVRLLRRSAEDFVLVGGIPAGYSAAEVVAYGSVLTELGRRRVGIAELPSQWSLWARRGGVAIESYTVMYTSDEGRRSFMTTGRIQDIPTLAVGVACDRDGLVNRCAAGVACRGPARGARCVELVAPAVAEAVAWVADGRLRSRARFAASEDPPTIEWRRLRDGVPITAWSTREASVELATTGALATVNAPLAGASGGDVIEWRSSVRLPGGALALSAPKLATNATVSPAGAGASCVFSETADVCDAGLRCAADASGAFACRAVPARCTEGLPQFGELAAPEPGGSTSLAIEPTRYDRNCFTSCNQRATVASAWRFVAPRAGRYSFKWTPTRAGDRAPQVSLRYGCRTYEYEATESCLPTSGESAGIGARTLREGEEILVVPFAPAGPAVLSVTAD
jgi:hypothetical protein